MAAKGSNARKKKVPAVKKKTGMVTEIFIQYGDKEISIHDQVMERIHGIWTKDMKEMKVYVKPEDDAAYFVINGDITGSFGL